MAGGRQKILNELTRTLDVTGYLSYRDFLRALYAAAKARIPDYSYLIFAEDCGFSRTNVLRLVIIGSRPLTVKAAAKVASALQLTGPARRYWLALVEYAAERVPARRDELFQELMAARSRAAPAALSPEQAEYFSEWYHPVIREMCGLAGFDGDPEWIRGRLAFPLRLDQVKKSLELLARLGMIRFDSGSGRWQRPAGRVATDSEVDSMAVVRFHQSMIGIARESITAVPEDRRDIRAVTVCLPRGALHLLKGKLEEWIHEVAALEVDGAAGDQVVQVNMQMFPFTKGEGEP